MPAVAVDAAALRLPPAPGEGARLTWLGHASWLVQLGGLSLLIDPVLGDSISVVIRRNGAPPLAAKALPPIAAQLVSHNHYDHMDAPSLRAVGAPVIVGLANARLIGGRLPTTELGWWDSADVGGVRVTYVPSQHWSRRSFADSNRALWGGFVIESGGLSIYHSGDTAYFEGFAEIGRRFPRIDVALLPIGAYDPAWFMSKQHMNPADALRAFEDLGRPPGRGDALGNLQADRRAARRAAGAVPEGCGSPGSQRRGRPRRRRRRDDHPARPPVVRKR